MGANMVNTVAEALADRVARLAGGRSGLRISPLLVLYEGAIVAVRMVEKKAATTGTASAAASSAPNPAE